MVLLYRTPVNEQKPIPPSFTSSPPVQSLGAGSKVTFVATDGKTYTGTIKETQGDQFKIKYDAFNFETWLQRDQFTVITANSSPPAFSTIPQNINPQSTYPTPSSSTPAFITSPAFWGSIMIVIGFFVNWIGYGYGYGFTGLNYLTGAIESVGNGGDQQWRVIVILICMLMIIISPIVCLLYSFGVGSGEKRIFFF